MFIEQLLKMYNDGERECWQCTEYIKHNPVLYPRVGDIFLRELFVTANPDRKVSYSRRKKVQSDSLWYMWNKEAYVRYVFGCELCDMLGLDLDIHLTNGKRIPFTSYWYLLCLFMEQARDLSCGEISNECLQKWKKDKEQRGICKPDCRKYYKTVGLHLEQVASDFPISKNYCPMQRELECERECPKQLVLTGRKIEEGTLNFRQKEELLYFSVNTEKKIPQEILAGELLYHYLQEEYMSYGNLLFEGDGNADVNCQMFTFFAYLTDCLSGFAWLKLQISFTAEIREQISQLEKEGLWQLIDLLKKPILKANNVLPLILLVVSLITPSYFCKKIERLESIDYVFDQKDKMVRIRIPEQLMAVDELKNYRLQIQKINTLLSKSDIHIKIVVSS